MKVYQSIMDAVVQAATTWLLPTWILKAQAKAPTRANHGAAANQRLPPFQNKATCCCVRQPPFHPFLPVPAVVFRREIEGQQVATD